MRARLALIVLLAAEAVAVWIVASHPPASGAVEWGDPLRWLQVTDPETATLVVGRWLVLVVAGWLLSSTLLALGGAAVAALPHAPRRIRRVGTRLTRCAPAAVVHLVEAALAVGVVSGAAAPAGAAPAPRTAVPVVAHAVVVALDPVRDGRAPAPTATPTAPPSPIAAAAAAADPPAPATPGRADPTPLGWGHHRVQPGEHLWSIAEAVVHARGDDDPAAVERYWRMLCDANRERVASGDVDVLAVGEDVDLPPVA